MAKSVCVGFKSSGKVYYYDPMDIDLHCGDVVIVETPKGVDMGIVRGSVREVPDDGKDANQNKVLRIANEKDMERDRTHKEKKPEAMSVCAEKIKFHNLEMKLIDVDFVFDDSKVVFYFTADNRIDFRELVKDLAGVFKKRIELRQVGVRDEAKMLGGIGSCGRCLCCAGWLQEFEPVSIKMAKVQNLSLNPTKISGSCGRLMCCLKYENDVYQEMKKGMPNQGEVVDTPEGKARVIEANILQSLVKVRMIEEEKTGDTQEKLSSDVHTYDKSAVIRNKKLGKKPDKSDSVDWEINEALADEIIDILKE